MNPYLSKFQSLPNNDFNSEKRMDLVSRYSWSIPTDEAITEVAVLPDIVEIGAGTGYWASLINAVGGHIQCFDLFPGDLNRYKHGVAHFPIGHRGVEVLRTHNWQTLLLSWPPYSSPMGFQCVRSFRGKYLVYIGEGWYGCTGTDAMHKRIDRDWEEKTEISLPQWFGIHDRLWIYERKR